MNDDELKLMAAYNETTGNAPRFEETCAYVRHLGVWLNGLEFLSLLFDGEHEQIDSDGDLSLIKKGLVEDEVDMDDTREVIDYIFSPIDEHFCALVEPTEAYVNQYGDYNIPCSFPRTVPTSMIPESAQQSNLFYHVQGSWGGGEDGLVLQINDYGEVEKALFYYGYWGGRIWFEFPEKYLEFARDVYYQEVPMEMVRPNPLWLVEHFCDNCCDPVVDCDCEQCEYCEKLTDDCDCERCDFCEEVMEECDCERCYWCEEVMEECDCA